MTNSGLLVIDKEVLMEDSLFLEFYKQLREIKYSGILTIDFINGGIRDIKTSQKGAFLKKILDKSIKKLDKEEKSKHK